MDAIVLRGLRKQYGAKEVLHGIDLRVPQGVLFGFLGPNGAGKTTTLRILLGLLRASGGAASVFGRDSWSDGPVVRKEIGYLPGEVTIYPHMSGRAVIDFMGSAQGGQDAREVDRLISIFELDVHKRVRDYSRGMKQKLALILALMNRAKLLVLDEPSTGLDPLMQEVLYMELRRVAGDDRTVLFSSHTLSEVAQLCDRVAILKEGNIIENERIDVLQDRALRRVKIEFADKHVQDRPMPTELYVQRQWDHHIEGTWKGSTDRLLTWLAGQQVKDIIIAPPDLEDLFLAFYSNSNKDTSELDAPPDTSKEPKEIKGSKA